MSFRRLAFLALIMAASSMPVLALEKCLSISTKIKASAENLNISTARFRDAVATKNQQAICRENKKQRPINDQIHRNVLAMRKCLTESSDPSSARFIQKNETLIRMSRQAIRNQQLVKEAYKCK